eukprot:963259-Rhodomonas_salina.6
MTDAVTPCRVEPDVELLSPGVVQLGAMRQSDDCLPDADDMVRTHRCCLLFFPPLCALSAELLVRIAASLLRLKQRLLQPLNGTDSLPDDDDIATVQRKVSKLLDDDAEKAEADARQE